MSHRLVLLLVVLIVPCIVLPAAAQTRSKGKIPAPAKGKPQVTPAVGATGNGSKSTVSAPTALAAPTASCTSTTALNAAEIDELLAAHNKLRSELKVQSLQWDCKLASYAQEWAARGQFEHRETNWGENLFVSSNGGEPIGSVVNKWLGERGFWNNATGECQTGKICTHYTQTVWKTTLRLGCGINRNGIGKWKLLVVCNYDPAGNSTLGPAY
jgi:pathogenesis-related protein 1